ncbi:MAG TPA: hypothetical protein VFG35_16265 [Actinoplanes sp.]|nr:hypothetical protein [Actinoplanes sp.]
MSMAGPDYATLRMTLRPPRVAVVVDGGDQWTFWARVAFHACSRVWGGRGFVLVPHHDGEVKAELLAAVRAYDPDYVVTLQQTLQHWEELRPGHAEIVEAADGTPLSPEDRARFLSVHPEVDVPSAAADQARSTVVEACAPHRRRNPAAMREVAGEDWDEDAVTFSVHGDGGRLTRIMDVGGPYSTFMRGTAWPGGSCLSAPPDWDGLLGVAVAAACGVVEMPVAGHDPELSEPEFQSLAPWLVESGLPLRPGTRLGQPIPQLIWQPDAVSRNIDPSKLGVAFDQTTTGITTIESGIGRPPRLLLSVGDTADDFATAHIYRQLYGSAVWLPIRWWPTIEAGISETPLQFVLRNNLTRLAIRGQGTTVTSSSVGTNELKTIIEHLQQPTAYGENDLEARRARTRELITSGTPAWSTRLVRYWAIADDFDKDFAVPITRNDAGDVEMVMPCPPPLPSEDELVGTADLRWQVDVQLHETETPHGRGLDGHTLLAAGEDEYLTWVRSGRDGYTFESERFNLIRAGTPLVGRLARPRLQAPSVGTWASLIAAQRGYAVRLSASGRRVEIMRRLWGDRNALAATFAGSMLPVLRRFRPAHRAAGLNLGPEEGVALPTGSGDVLFEPYLTIDGLMKAAGAEQEAISEVRRQADDLLEQTVLRRGLILGCAQCGKLAFVVIDDLGQVNRCPRCAAHNQLRQPRWRSPMSEPRWFYDLHPTVREHIAQDGDMPLLLSHYLRSGSRDYADVAELELLDASGSPVAEVDLLALADRQVITAETKRPSDMGSGKALRHAIAKRALLAEQLQADQILLATAAPSWPRAVIDALSDEITKRPWSRVVPRPRLVCGLGTGAVVDLQVDPATQATAPWSAQRG